MAFTKGQSGNPLGRPAGSQNAWNRDVKELFLLAAERAGGLPRLTEFAQEKPEVFWPLIAKMLPKTVQGAGDAGELVVTIVRKTAALPTEHPAEPTVPPDMQHTT